MHQVVGSCRHKDANTTTGMKLGKVEKPLFMGIGPRFKRRACPKYLILVFVPIEPPRLLSS
ncbi:hypothetical protein LguiA_035236 [Lonicera macranthoides]